MDQLENPVKMCGCCFFLIFKSFKFLVAVWAAFTGKTVKIQIIYLLLFFLQSQSWNCSLPFQKCISFITIKNTQLFVLLSVFLLWFDWTQSNLIANQDHSVVKSEWTKATKVRFVDQYDASEREKRRNEEKVLLCNLSWDNIHHVEFLKAVWKARKTLRH